MKKLILLLALGLSLCANAQLTVLESGRVLIGDYTYTNTSPTAILDISSFTRSLGTSGQYVGSVCFGSGTGSYITGCSGAGYLNLQASAILNLGVGDAGSILSIIQSSRSISSRYPITAPSFMTSSDARLKTNVESLSVQYSKLKDINAVSYNLSTPPVAAPAEISFLHEVDAEIKDPVAVDNRTHFGFIAQEIQEIFPNLVVEGEDGMLAIDYTGFIPLLVEAYKDLSVKVKDQEELISEMAKIASPRQMPASVAGLTDQKALLKQNKPNPFNTTTVIECSIPQTVASAFICVYDLQGKQVHRIDIADRGEVVNVIDASCFAPGMYFYALIADGMEIDSKRMIITD